VIKTIPALRPTEYSQVGGSSKTSIVTDYDHKSRCKSKGGILLILYDAYSKVGTAVMLSYGRASHPKHVHLSLPRGLGTRLASVKHGAIGSIRKSAHSDIEADTTEPLALIYSNREVEIRGRVIVLKVKEVGAC
jgi:hypothetical protein